MRTADVIPIRTTARNGDAMRPRGRPKSRLVDLNEVARYLHVSRATIYRLIDKGLPCLRVGWVIRFDLSLVLSWLAEYTRQGRRAHWTDEYPEIKRRDEAAGEDPDAKPSRTARYRSTKRRVGPLKLEPPADD